jgi:hypothetical protein
MKHPSITFSGNKIGITFVPPLIQSGNTETGKLSDHSLLTKELKSPFDGD